MKTLLLVLLLSGRCLAAFTEFYVQSTGNNLNAGAPAATDTGAVDDAASYTYAGGTFVRATGVFTVASGNPSGDGVAVGDFASIYTTAGATVATFVGRVTARDATTITVSLTAIAGATSTVSETAAAATCKVGGAWAGPSGTVGFPFSFVAGTLTNSSGHKPRVNFLAATYAMTAGITQSTTGIIQFQGYTATPGDGGRATLDGGTGTYYILLTVSAGNSVFTDFTFANNGNTGSAADGVNITGGEIYFNRCVFHDFRRAGVRWAGGVGHMIECEAYACNTSNTNNFAAFTLATAVICIRCIAHDNPGSNVDGFAVQGSTLIECISETNGRNGVRNGTADTIDTFQQCDFYNNGAAGISLGTGSGTGIVTIENCNFVKNTTWGILFNNAISLGVVHNCGFGAGTQANGSGNISAVDGPEISGSITYAANVTPWADPANGDFRITLDAAKRTGRGAYLQTASNYTGTRGFPNIGAAQHREGGGSFLQFFSP